MVRRETRPGPSVYTINSVLDEVAEDNVNAYPYKYVRASSVANQGTLEIPCTMLPTSNKPGLAGRGLHCRLSFNNQRDIDKITHHPEAWILPTTRVVGEHLLRKRG